MENASKALMIAGTVLIGVLLIALLVYLFTSAYGMRSSYSENINNIRITEFNTKFTKYNITINDYKNSNGKNYVTIHDIVTLANYAKEFNNEVGQEDAIQVKAGSIEVTDNERDLNDLLKTNMVTIDSQTVERKYVILENTGIQFNNTTGRIKLMQFRELTNSEYRQYISN